MKTCDKCYQVHRRTRICGEDVAAEAREFVDNMKVLQERVPNPVEAWILSFAEAREEHLSDAQCLWFEYLVRLNDVHPDAAAAFSRLPVPVAKPLTGVHVGTVSARSRFVVTCYEVRDLGVHEKYGQRFLVKMRTPTPDGDAELVWFTGENLFFDVGDVVDVTARVEEHGEFNSVRQTRVSRLKEAKPDG